MDKKRRSSGKPKRSKHKENTKTSKTKKKFAEEKKVAEASPEDLLAQEEEAKRLAALADEEKEYLVHLQVLIAAGTCSPGLISSVDAALGRQEEEEASEEAIPSLPSGFTVTYDLFGDGSITETTPAFFPKRQRIFTASHDIEISASRLVQLHGQSSLFSLAKSDEEDTSGSHTGKKKGGGRDKKKTTVKSKGTKKDTKRGKRKEPEKVKKPFAPEPKVEETVSETAMDHLPPTVSECSEKYSIEWGLWMAKGCEDKKLGIVRGVLPTKDEKKEDDDTMDALLEAVPFVAADSGLDGAPGDRMWFCIVLQTDRPLMNKAMEQQLNPLTMTVVCARNLPDTPVSRIRLAETSVPIFCTYQLFGHLGRQIVTWGAGQSSNPVWNHRAVFLCGDLGNEEPEERTSAMGDLLEGSPVCIEVHDRNRSEEAGSDPFALAALGRGSTLVKGKVEILPGRGGIQGDGGEVVHLPGHYLEADSVLKVRATLARPLCVKKQGPKHAFSRLVVVVPRSILPKLEMMTLPPSITSRVVRRLKNSVREGNADLLGLEKACALSELATFEMKEEHQSMDLLTGIEVADPDSSILLIEGLAGPDKALGQFHQRVMDALLEGRVEQDGWNPDHIRILHDPTITFAERLYNTFGLDMKRLELQQTVKGVLTQDFHTYVRSAVPRPVYDALHRLHALSTALRLRDIRRGGLFPESYMLDGVGKKYGAGWTGRDGDEADSMVELSLARAIAAQRALEEEEEPESQDGDTIAPGSTARSTRSKLRIDAVNPAFEASLRRRKPVNHIRKNKELYPGYVDPAVQEAKYLRDDEADQVFIYSGQRNNTLQRQVDAVRDYAAGAKNHYMESQVLLDGEGDGGACVGKWKGRDVWKDKWLGDDFRVGKVHDRGPSLSQARLEELREPYGGGKTKPVYREGV